MCVCPFPPYHLCKDHVGADIFCRVGTMANYEAMEPLWRRLGTLGTEGHEGEKPDSDIAESWGWTLSDVMLSSAAIQAHLTEWPLQ